MTLILLLAACTAYEPLDKHFGFDDTAIRDSAVETGHRDTGHRDTSHPDTGTPPDTGRETGVETDEPPPEPWSFVVFGDNQFATESCTSGVDERLAIPEAVVDLAPDMVLHTGDLMDHGYDDGAYDTLRSCYSGMLGTLPFFPTPGNHDEGSGGIYNYEAFLEQQLFTDNATRWQGDYATDVSIAYEDDPNTYSEDPSYPSQTDDVPSGFSYETFYAAKLKNAYIVSFEIGTRWWANTPRSWLESHLRAAHEDPEVEHIFVIMHHPLYSTTMAESSDGECIGPVRDDYEDLFRAYDVTIAFSGHAHVYEHFSVPDDETPTRADPAPTSFPHDGNTVQYVVTGGGGGGLPGCDPMASPIEDWSYDFVQGRGCGYHVTRVQVEGTHLRVEVIGVEGDESSQTMTTWDTWTVG